MLNLVIPFKTITYLPSSVSLKLDILPRHPTLKSSVFFGFVRPFGCIMPIIRLDFMLSSTIWTYLGSKILNGAEVFGKNIKFESGNTGIILGKLSILFITKKK